MNLLGLVLGLLMIFACTFTLSLRKATIAQEVEKNYQAHLQASRNIRNSYESLCYRRMRSVEPDHSGTSKKNVKKKSQSEFLNPACARLNLWPLLTDGAEEHPALYETAAQLLRTFYASSLFNQEPRFEYRLLDAILDAAKKEQRKPGAPSIFLEKLSLCDIRVKPLYTMQTIYYLMLRGTRTMAGEKNYPPLLEHMTIERKKSLICLHHASIEMLSALFGPRAALAISQELQESETALTPDRIQDLCSRNGTPGLSDEFLNLFDWQTSRRHSSEQKTLVQEEANVYLKQKVFFPS